jgi:hypothetical protein
MVDEAQFTGLPLLCLPPDTSPGSGRSGRAPVHRQRRGGPLHRVLAIQTTLLSALATSDPPTEMIQRLGQQLGISVILYDHRRSVLACHGEAPVHLIANCLDNPVGGQPARRRPLARPPGGDRGGHRCGWPWPCRATTARDRT